MSVLFTNLAEDELASGIIAADTEIPVTDGSIFSQPTGGDYAMLKLSKTVAGVTTREIVKLTGVAANTLTVVRGQEGTTAIDWAAGATIEEVLTAATLTLLAQGYRSSETPGTESLDLQPAGTGNEGYGSAGTNCVSVGFGAGSTGTPNEMVAIGSWCVVEGNYSVGMGYNAVCAAVSSVSIGYSANVTSGSDYSVALGRQSSATANNCIAIGYSAVASAASTVVAGSQATAGGAGAVSIGDGATTPDQGSVTIGSGAESAAGATNAVAVGTGSYNTYSGAVALGAAAYTESQYAVAIGYGATTYPTADHAIAIGPWAINRITYTFSHTGMSVIRKDNGEPAADSYKVFTGEETVIMSKEIDLTTLADNAAVITIPSGASFYPNEVGLIVTSADTVSVQPYVSFGDNSGGTTSLLASTQTTKSAAKGRDRYTTLVADDGLTTSVNASVKTAATATTMLGRFYFKGMLVEDE